MLNGIAVSLLAWAINFPLKFTDAPPGQNVDLRTDPFPEQGLVGDIGQYFDITPGAHLSWLLFLAIAAAAIVWFLIRRTRLGYDARAVGSSPGSARAGGVSIGATQLKLFLISGALAGLVGMQQILADRGHLPQNYIVALGFTGIAVAFLGQNNPIGIVFAAILWGILSRGEVALQIQSEVPREFIIILQGILILSVVITYQIAKRRLAARQLQRAGEAGTLEDSAGPGDAGTPSGTEPEPAGTKAFQPADEREG
jgi:simple sugar transport system permease protein